MKMKKRTVVYKTKKRESYLLLPLAVPYGKETQKDADKRVLKFAHILRC